MAQTRRQFVKNAVAAGAAIEMGVMSTAQAASKTNHRYKRIAIEEAFTTPQVAQAIKPFFASDAGKAYGWQSIWKYYKLSQAQLEMVVDIGEGRIAEMDKSGIDMMLLSHTSNGVQSFEADLSMSLLRDTNDVLADAVKTHPDRFAGMVAIAPHATIAASKEVERGITKLGLKGVIINSHAGGEFLDSRKFWPLFETIEALDVPIYLHPAPPPPQMNKPFLDYGLAAAMFGFAVESGLHALRLILSGLFDEFPKLKIVLGHCGEVIPFYLDRIDIHYGKIGNNREVNLKRLPSDYFRDNFWVSTAGMNGSPSVPFCCSVLGAERVMFAADYPYELPLRDEVVKMDETPLPASDMEKIYHTNAEGLFRL